jgi:hypothetical protein
MATPNYVLIGEYTTSTTVASVTLGNIPQTGYTDLKVMWSARSNSAYAFDRSAVTFNGSNTYTWKEVAADGTTPGSSGYTAQSQMFNVTPAIVGGTATAGVYSTAQMYITNYTSTNTKAVSLDWGMENNSATAYFIGFDAGISSLTSAISSITIAPTLGSFVAGCTFSLYGIAAVGTTPSILPKATGGDIITNDGTYWYHAFLSSNIFTPASDLTCDVLQIAGGGAGGWDWAAGGGAGGIFYKANNSLTASAYVCTVGAGGAGVVGGQGGNGTNSTFTGTGISLTAAVGGGGGGIGLTSAGSSGGSGGGGGYGSSPVRAGGATTQTGTGGTGYGNAGGSGAGTSASEGSGGGGGAGGAGANAGSGVGGAGGVGTTAFSSWGLATSTGENSGGTVYYAGGGGGVGRSTRGAAGLGGGGTTVVGSARTNLPNMGGGGAGDAGTGGSGIIIVRYTMAV